MTYDLHNVKLLLTNVDSKYIVPASILWWPTEMIIQWLRTHQKE